MVVNYDIPSLIVPNKSGSQSKSVAEIDFPTNPHENNTFVNLNLNQNQLQNTTELTEDPIYNSADEEIKYLSSETDEDENIHL